MRKSMRRLSRNKPSELTKLAAREKELKQALLDALEMCYDGRFPFGPLERALKSAR